MPDTTADNSRFPLLPEDLESVDWKSTLSGLTSNNELEIRDQTKTLLKDAQEASDERAIRLWGALDGLMSMSLNNDDSAVPLHPTMTTPEWRTAALVDFPAQTIGLLAELVPDSKSPVIVARISDAVWITNRDAKQGRVAVASYLQSAELDKSSGRIMWALPKITRAANVSAELGKGAPLYLETMEKIAGWIPTAPASPQQSYLSRSLLDLIFDLRWGSDPLEWANVAKEFADAEISGLRADFAIQFLELEIRFCERASSSDRVKLVRERIATSYESQADTGSHMQNAHWLTKAIQAWREVGGKRERVDGLIVRLKEEQKAATTEMSEIRTPFDATEIAEYAKRVVKDKTELDAILAIAIAVSSPERAEIEKEIRADAKAFPMSMLFGRSIQNREGNVSAQIPHYDFSEGDNDKWVQGHVSTKYAERQTFVAQTLIETARREIAQNGQVGVRVWRELVTDNPFVPAGREEFFVRGLHAGLLGELASCAHFLIPQLENSVRHVVAMAGGVVTKPSPDNPGVQVEIDLNQLLKDPRYNTKTIEIFGEDLVLDLSALLVDGTGHNLRNRLCHGLEDWNDFFSYSVVYLWWITLHLCVRGYLLAHPDPEPEPTAETESDGGADSGDPST